MSCGFRFNINTRSVTRPQENYYYWEPGSDKVDEMNFPVFFCPFFSFEFKDYRREENFRREIRGNNEGTQKVKMGEMVLEIWTSESGCQVPGFFLNARTFSPGCLVPIIPIV